MKPSALSVLAYLQRSGWVTDYQIIEATHMTQGGRRLRELRALGYAIERRRRIGLDGKALSTYEYRLLGMTIGASHSTIAKPQDTSPAPHPSPYTVSTPKRLTGQPGGLPGASPGPPPDPRQATLPLEVQGRPHTEYGPP